MDLAGRRCGRFPTKKEEPHRQERVSRHQSPAKSLPHVTRQIESSPLRLLLPPTRPPIFFLLIVRYLWLSSTGQHPAAKTHPQAATAPGQRSQIIQMYLHLLLVSHVYSLLSRERGRIIHSYDFRVSLKWPPQRSSFFLTIIMDPDADNNLLSTP